MSTERRTDNAAARPTQYKPRQVYLFGTCLVDVFYPEAGMSVVHLLEREGIQVIYPQDQTCCGQPAYNSGLPEAARAVASAQLALFSDPWPVIVPSASCAGMFRHHYPRLFKGHAQEHAATELASRVYEFAEFLVDVLDIRLQDTGAPTSLALHHSCSAQREMEVTHPTEQLLKQLEQVTVLKHEYAHECCGFGGTFAVKSDEISAAMAADKCVHLQATGAEAFITGDCGCLLNLNGTLDKQSAPKVTHPSERFRGTHLATFLWQRTRK